MGTVTVSLEGGAVSRSAVHRSVSTRVIGLVTALSVALLVAPSPASAENDPYGVFVNDRTGQRWVTMSPSEYLASPITLDMQARMEALSAGDFKAGAAWAFDDTPDPKWDVFQVGDVTRLRSVASKRTTISYVIGDRVCTRKVSKASNDSLKADRTARWTCKPSSGSTTDGREFVGPFLPLSVVSPAKDGELRVLMKEGASVPAPGAANATLSIIIREIGLLRSYGLFAGPSEYYEFTVTATNMETVEEAFNGYSWLMGDFVLSTTLLPRLPRLPRIP
jgi:hypothetical protein